MRTDDELRREIGKHYWFHEIELRPGISTPGNKKSEILPLLGIPGDLTGKTVLDIGTWDGFHAFECERRGAKRVVAMDLWENSGRGAFDLAKEELNSGVEALECDIYDLHPFERFDLVLFLGVLYHLKHPLLALEKMAACVSPGGMAIIETVVDKDKLLDPPMMSFHLADDVNNDPTTWWTPNVAGLGMMLVSAGFSQVISQVQLYAGNRSVFHAVKGTDEHVKKQEEQERDARRGLFGKKPPKSYPTPMRRAA